jgi:D-lactate dehydrogenase
VLGNGTVRALSRVVRRVGPAELIPEWSAGLPRAAPRRLPATQREGAAAVYLPACINRIMGTSRDDADALWLPAALVAVSERAGLPVWIPDDAPGHCCGTPWSSKGFRAGHAAMSAQLADALWRWSDEGRLPVVIDATSCAHGIAEELADERVAKVSVLDAVTWAHEHLLSRLEIRSPVGSAVVHPTCSARHLGLAATMEALTGALATETVVPLTATCCGMAGDRGLLYPELTAAATSDEAAEVTARPFDAHVSANRTCEVALERATGRPYMSVIQLLELASRP